MDSRELTPVAEYREGEIIAPGEETPLPAELVATAKAFQTMARAASTRRAYHRAWTDFDDWCRQHGRTGGRLVRTVAHQDGGRSRRQELVAPEREQVPVVRGRVHRRAYRLV